MLGREDPTSLRWPRALVAAGSGVAASAMLAFFTGLDTRLVKGFQGTRTAPYRAVFFVVLAGLCAISNRLSGGARDARAIGRMALAGASTGYLAGILASFFVSFVLVSPAGAWRSLTSGVDGPLVDLVVPVASFSWLFGFVAYVGAALALHARSLRGEGRSSRTWPI